MKGALRPEDRLLALPLGDAVLLIELKPPNDHELRLRRLLNTPDPARHEALAREAAKDNDGFATAFHKRQALAGCDRLLAENPRLPAMYLQRARLRAELFQFDEAVADIIAGLALGGRSRFR